MKSQRKKRFLKLNPQHITCLKVIIHAVSLFFLTVLVLQTFNGGFGADPVKDIEHFTGKAALNTLFITMLISPIAMYLKQGALVKTRRVLGLYSFFWALLHLSVYVSLDLGFDWALVGEEITQRPYLAIGAISWLILLLLTLTSTQKLQRILGANWQKLHNWVYLALLLSPIHYLWSVKSGIIEPAIYIVIASLLLLNRRDKFKRGLTNLGINRDQKTTTSN
ncbi:protein-methionine-sulfoxide reductase heme-binding subunit MsrQ [Photobacterium sp. GB-210]|uniref:protein-methionine-sulfoxide reductase heme-binding subunit MsrQ n=1 Tax=Photobacterium sp. GB-210 TaxID=2022104 RepID=UPI000D15FBE7|nr:protein-methionine-sulfoxide reductase heme-binding subunit MsrQ [Photobacterium sp. GB-210]PSV37376.1 protein-methionine-sulfoxide reductase heme-binding subunit MsrQ [Photobacterium sp. GB-210]